MTIRPLPPLAAAVAISLSLGAGHARAAPETYALDPEHTTIAFMVEHIGYADILGLFRSVEGSFVYDDETQTLSDVTVTIEAGSVWTNNEPRDEHVRNADFLNVAEHPTITFTASGGEVTGENEGTVTGDLTILGQTHPITLDVKLNKIGDYPFGHTKETLGASARGTVVRSKYGMNYAVEPGFVGDEIELLIEFEAIKQD